jgi:hypothetical protein
MAPVNVKSELATIASSLEEISTRISALVDDAADDVGNDVYTELVAAERTIRTLLRRLTRVTSRSR